jgi:hypothetical protein
MKYVDRFKGIPYSELTPEQFDSLTAFELVNKTISEDVDGLIKYHDKFTFMKQNLLASTALTIFMTFFIGSWSMLGIIPIVFFLIMYQKRKMNVTWSMRILKMSIAVLRGCSDEVIEIDHVFENQLSRLDGIIDIGEHYNSVRNGY